MRKLLFILSIFIFSSCESKFDGLQGGIFVGYRTNTLDIFEPYIDQLTFDSNKAYLTVSFNKNENFYLGFNLYEPNSKIIKDFTQLFEKYNLNESFDSSFVKKSFEYIEFNNKIENLINLSDYDFDYIIMSEDNPYNPTGKSVLDLSGWTNFGLINKILRMNVEMVLNKIDYETIEFSYSIRRKEKLNFIFDYKKVGQNQISFTKPTTKPNYSDYYEVKRELEILINKYENEGYVFNYKSILNIPSFFQEIEDDYLKSNYYLNKSEDGYTLENLEHNFSYTEVR